MPHLRASRRSSPAAGSVLPLVLVALVAIGVLALAGYETARFALQAARAQVAATAALHAADSGLDLYLRGVGPPAGPVEVEAPPGVARVTVVELAPLGDTARLVEVVAEGSARRGAGPPLTRRLRLLAVVDSAGGRRRVAGSWREQF